MFAPYKRFKKKLSCLTWRSIEHRFSSFFYLFLNQAIKLKGTEERKSRQFYGYYFNRNIMQINLIDIQLTACNLNFHICFHIFPQFEPVIEFLFLYFVRMQLRTEAKMLSVTIDRNCVERIGRMQMRSTTTTGEK